MAVSSAVSSFLLPVSTSESIASFSFFFASASSITGWILTIVSRSAATSLSRLTASLTWTIASARKSARAFGSDGILETSNAGFFFGGASGL